MPPLRGLGFLVTCCYKHAIPTGFKRVLKSSRFPRKIRFGWETEPTGPRAAAVIFLKLTPMGAVRKPNLPGLGNT